MTTPLSVSIIIPVHNNAAALEECLTSVFASVSPAQVLVVDDGSTDGAGGCAARFPCQLVQLSCNGGAAAARNIGARAADGDILFFLDSDIIMQPNTITRITCAFANDATLAALFGSYRSTTVPTNFVSVYKNLLHHYTHQISSPEAATFCSGYGAIRREVFDELNGFDSSQRALEDIEFGYRLHRAGYRVRLLKDLQFTHLKRYTLRDLVRSDVQQRAIPWTRLMLQHRIFRNDLNTRSNNVVSVALAFLLLLAPVWVWFVPYGWVLTVALLVAFVLLNLDFIAFVTRQRGILFGIQTLLMTWFFYVYSGIGVVIGVGSYCRDRLVRPRVA